MGWDRIFYFAATLMTLNLIMTLLFFKADEQDKKINKSLKEEITHALHNIKEALSDYRFVLFLVIVIGFWTMYNQLFYTLPTFVHDWMDTSIVYDKVYAFSPWLAKTIGNSQGIIPPEVMTDIDALYIILFQILVSWAVMKMKPINAMMTGFLICAIGLGLTFMQHNPMYLFITVLVFSIGEMASSPKITEYISKIAPKDKIALYMGCSFIPMAGGNYFAGWLSGDLYGRLSDKAELLSTDLINRGINIPTISEQFTKTDLFELGQNTLNMSSKEMTQYLWETYNPSSIWMVFVSIGVGCFLLLFLYNKFILKEN